MPRRLIALLMAAAGVLATGRAQGNVALLEGSTAPQSRLDIQGSPGFRITITADARGRYSALLPYGAYTVTSGALRATCLLHILPLVITRCDLRPNQQQIAPTQELPAGGAYNGAQRILFHLPAAFIYPLDFANLASIRLPSISIGGLSWTETGYRLNSLDATDSYQPGKPVLLDDAMAETSILTRDHSGADMYDLATFLRSAAELWHGGLASEDTGSIVASDNLPPVPDRGIVLRPEKYRWFTRDTAELSGPLGRWADISATGTGQWASQTVPQWASGIPIGSRMLFGNARGTVRITARDRLDALYSGSRLDLSAGGWPAGMEAILASRALPSYFGVSGFENLRETDHLDLVQTGWLHVFAPGARALEIRYGYSTGHLDTTGVNGAHQVDLLDPLPAYAPVSNFAVRTRHEFRVAYQGEAHAGKSLHTYTLGGHWQRSEPRNRFQSVSANTLITAGGEPAFIVDWNTPADTRTRIVSLAAYAGDVVRFAHAVTSDISLAFDHATGRVAPNANDAISWLSPSPHAGIAAPLPFFPRASLRAGYSRKYSRLAGRYLDFADPGALAGLVYDPQSGRLLRRFGGGYSSIARGLKRPHTDEFHLGAGVSLPLRTSFTVDLFRRDNKNRVAAVNTGVPAITYQPVTVHDSGPDFQPGTFDDQSLVVYAQDPSTLGRDEYLLTNPGLRELTETLTATLNTHHTHFDVRVSFTAEKSFGPANPGDALLENDPAVVGTLYNDPNTLIHATGHPFVDRAFLGKFQADFAAPTWLGGIQFSNRINYLDGLPFARELLVTGLPQGPFLVATTQRGSPEGGNRAEYVLNWNLRISREFALCFLRVKLTADLLNVLNNGNKIIETDLSGALFNRRPALAIPPPRMLRIGFRWHF